MMGGTHSAVAAALRMGADVLRRSVAEAGRARSLRNQRAAVRHSQAAVRRHSQAAVRRSAEAAVDHGHTKAEDANILLAFPATTHRRLKSRLLTPLIFKHS